MPGVVKRANRMTLGQARELVAVFRGSVQYGRKARQHVDVFDAWMDGQMGHKFPRLLQDELARPVWQALERAGRCLRRAEKRSKGAVDAG